MADEEKNTDAQKAEELIEGPAEGTHEWADSTAPLTDREELVVCEYLKTLNKSETARRVNMHMNGVDKMLRRPNVRERVAIGLQELKKATDLDIVKVMEAAKRYVEFDPAVFIPKNASAKDAPVVPLADLPIEARLCIQGVKIRTYTVGRGTQRRRYTEYEYKWVSRIDAVDKLSRFFAMYNDKIKLDVKHDIRVVQTVEEQPETVLSTQN